MSLSTSGAGAARRRAPGLTLAEAADQLGVHYMTAYRYVRTGLLPAEQREGKWHVSAADFEAFRAGQAAAAPRRRAGRRSTDTPATALDPRRAVALADRLVSGDQSGAWSVVEDALASGAGPHHVYTELLGPALRHIGDRWEAGDLTVAAEHRGSVVAMRLIGRLGPRFTRPGRKRGSVVLAAAPGDRHGLPTAILADLLRFDGLNVTDVGADTPADELVRAALGEDRLLGVGISVTTPMAVATQRQVRKAVRAVHDVTGRPVLVGGAGASAELARRLGADHWTTTAEEAVAWFAGLHPVRRTPPAERRA